MHLRVRLPDTTLPLSINFTIISQIFQYFPKFLQFSQTFQIRISNNTLIMFELLYVIPYLTIELLIFDVFLGAKPL